MSAWSGEKVRKARAHWAVRLPLPCRRCKRMVTKDQRWHVGHIVDRCFGGTDEIANTWPEHGRCSESAGGQIGSRITNARHAAPRLASERARGIRGI